MSTPTRSLKYEYAKYLDLEIDFYKETMSRPALMKLGDDAFAAMEAAIQLELSEIVMNDAVNALIMKRLKLPTYERWRRNRLKVLEQFRRADHWGLASTLHLADAVRPQDHPHVVVAGPHVEERTLYLAANGAHVTALSDVDDEALMSKVMVAAAQAGLSGQVASCSDGLDVWSPSVPVRAVVWHAQVLDSLSAERRTRVLAQLQDATVAGGVHYIEGVPTEARTTASIRSLIANYPGWHAPTDSGNGVIVLHKPRVA
ncbi:MAG: hypothetical protein H7099_02900 [Gemmatimonadaceae bacterium]|nr:hypothetical protein [Gemmatimonadaceae bacterium]